MARLAPSLCASNPHRRRQSYSDRRGHFKRTYPQIIEKGLAKEDPQIALVVKEMQVGKIPAVWCAEMRFATATSKSVSD